MKTVPRIRDKTSARTELVDDGKSITVYIHVGEDKAYDVDECRDLHPVAALADIHEGRVTGVEIILNRDSDGVEFRAAEKKIKVLEREIEVLSTRVRRLTVTRKQKK